MHRVFYRVFGSRSLSQAFWQILAGILVGTVVGVWLFLLFSMGLDAEFNLALSQGVRTAFSLLVCGTFPLLLAGILFCLGFVKSARFLSPAVSAALLSFSSLTIFLGGGYDSLLAGTMLFLGRIVSLVWLFLFLLQKHKGEANWPKRELVLSVILTVLSLLFFAWLTEPSLKAISILSCQVGAAVCWI